MKTMVDAKLRQEIARRAQERWITISREIIGFPSIHWALWRRMTGTTSW